MGKYEIIGITTVMIHQQQNNGILYQSLTAKSHFNNPKEKRLLKTLWEKEKMQVTSIFSFSHMFS